MKFLKILVHIILIVFLTALTQVGGLIWLLSILISKKRNIKKRIVFPVLYLFFNLILTPPIAKYFGRVRLPTFSHKIIKPKNFFYPLLFRNYVKPKLKIILEESAVSLNKEFPNSKLIYLDANFPFYDGFPLLPHLSHNDGKKIDLSFFYLDKNKIPTNKKPSYSGYGIFEHPKRGEINTTTYCKGKGYWQYDYAKSLTFGTTKSLIFNKKITYFLIRNLLKNSYTQKIFIEPHLKIRLNITSNRVRFHGCKAVRHDDHIHLQIK